MTTSEALPRFRHPVGLPGKDIKLQKDADKVEKGLGHGAGRSTRERSPLGISIDTNVNQSYDRPPKQIFTTTSGWSPDVNSSVRGRLAGSVSDSPSMRSHALNGRPQDAAETANATTCSGRDVTNEAWASGAGINGNGRLKNNLDSSKTPIIILDSAQSDRHQMAELSREGHAPRTPSSIYTLAQQPATVSTPPEKARKFPRLNVASIPPISKLGMPFISIKTPASVGSTSPSASGLDRDENGNDSASSPKRSSPNSAGWFARRLSMDFTPPTPRRSKGWWNFITSPFEANRRTFASSPKDSVYTTASDAPEVPALKNASPPGVTKDRGIDDNHIDPGSTATQSGRSSPLSPVHGGEADNYYNSDKHFGEEHFVPGLHEIAEESCHSTSSWSTGLDKHSDDDDDHRRLSRPNSPQARTVAPSGPPILMPETPHTDRDILQPRPLAPRYDDYFSQFGNGTPVHNQQHSHQPSTPTTKSPPDTMSPGVVEVADARPFRMARSIRTKSSRRSLLSERYDQRPTTEDFFATRNGPQVYHHVDEERPKPPPLPAKAHLDRPIAQQYHEEKAEHYTTMRDEEAPNKGGYFQRQWHRQENVEEPKHVGKRFQFEKPKRDRLSAFKRHKILTGAGIFLFILCLVIVIVSMTVVRHHHDMPVAASWMNVTGFTPIPTGIATIARPNPRSDSSCVANPDLWSCALPKEEQAAVLPSKPNQPNFRLEIRFTGKSKQLANSTSSPLSRRSLLSRSLTSVRNVKRDVFHDLTTWADPPPPSKDDQTFLGNTTDHNHTPFDGEDTPFTISFLPTTNPPDLNSTNSPPSSASSPTNAKRAYAPTPTPSTAGENNTNNTAPLPNLPPPQTLPNNTITPAQLYPNPSAQPLKLYDRGLPTEHYGFYTYFSKTQFMSLAGNNTNLPDSSNTPGGSSRSDANAFCTFSQTRFRVQIWTRSHPVTPVSGGGVNNGTDVGSAVVFERPGTFPLGVTVSLDRHGGDAAQKGVYCYGLDEMGKPDAKQKDVIAEVKEGFVNVAGWPFEGVDLKGFGGSDGGTGGCGCEWTSF